MEVCDRYFSMDYLCFQIFLSFAWSLPGVDARLRLQAKSGGPWHVQTTFGSQCL
jgi:hypothetical protein